MKLTEREMGQLTNAALGGDTHATERGVREAIGDACELLAMKVVVYVRGRVQGARSERDKLLGVPTGEALTEPQRESAARLAGMINEGVEILKALGCDGAEFPGVESYRDQIAAAVEALVDAFATAVNDSSRGPRTVAPAVDGLYAAATSTLGRLVETVLRGGK